MNEQFVDALLRLSALWCGVGLWGLTLWYVFWDSGRRRLPSGHRARWLLLSLLPFLGFFLYLLSRRRGAETSRRVTEVRHHVAAEVADPPTLPGAYWGQAGAAGASMVLAATEGPYTGQRFAVNTFPATIGRSSTCTVRLQEDTAISRRHAELYRQAGQVRLRDLDSTHGTILNGNLLGDQPLYDGDTIRLGNSTLVVAGLEERS